MAKLTTRVWYDRTTRNWIGQVVDEDGNQIGNAVIAYTKQEVELFIKDELLAQLGAAL